MSTENQPPLKPSLTIDALLRHAGFLRSLARSLLHDDHLAEDALQHACLVAMQSPPRDARYVRAWLATVVRNFAGKMVRSSTRTARLEARTARSEVVAPVDALLESERAMRAIVEAVLGLEEPYRSTVIRRFYENQPPRVIAAIDRVAVATVHSRLQRSLVKLRADLRRNASLHGIASLAGLELARNTVIAGGVLMGTKTVVGIAAGIVVVGSFVWFAVREERATERAREAAGAVVASRADAVGTPARASATPEPERTAAEPPPAPAATSTSEASVAPAAARELDPVTASFLTGEPDLRGLLETVRSLSVGATVDEASVTTKDGVVKGQLVLADAEIKATFEIEDGRFSVEVRNPAAKLPSPFVNAGLYMTFREHDGNAADTSAGVQFHPDTRRSPADFLGEDQERYVGWSASIGADGSRARPISMRRHGRSWVIGHAKTFVPIDDRYVQDTTPFNAWLRLLAPHAR